MDYMKTIVDLPDEALVKIFSFFDSKELKRVELVCWKFYHITKNPSFWRKIEVKIDSRPKLQSLCNFFCKYNYIQKLKLDFKVDYKLTKDDVNDLNRLLSNLNQLWCLHVKELDIAKIIISPTVTYFNYYYSKEVNCDAAKQFLSVLNCSKIESLIMIFVWNETDLFNPMSMRKVAAAGKDILEKYKSSLKILHLRPLHYQWSSYISQCLNLKELTVLFGYFIYSKEENEELGGIARLPQLESLVIDYEVFSKFSDVLERYGLPKLKNLSIVDSLPCGQKDFVIIRKKIPNLMTLSLSGTLDVKGLCKLVNRCKTLKYFCFGGECVCSKDRKYLLNKICNLSKERKFESICFCEVIYRYTLIDKVDYVRWYKGNFKNELFSCKKCYSSTSVSLQCRCWPEKRLNSADRFFALHGTSRLENFPSSDEMDSSSESSDNDG